MNNNKLGNILMIAYHYPPQINGGTPRPQQFKKYLDKIGYNVFVITTSKYGITKDKNVIYVDEENSITRKFKMCRNLYRLTRWALYKFGIKSSKLLLWNANVKNEIKNLLSQTNLDLVLATYPPTENLELGLKISEKYGIPLVTDFRDGFNIDPFKRENFLIRKKKEIFEKKIIEKSNKIICVTPNMNRYYNEKFRFKSVMITNGFDPENFIKPVLKIKSNIFRIVYTGQLSLSREGVNINTFIEALKFVTESYEIDDIVLDIYGKLTSVEVQSLKLSLGKKFNYHGLVSHEESIYNQRKADLLLFSTGSLDFKDATTTKIFEYIKSGTPILAITKGTFAEKIILETGTGICFDNSDIEGVKEILYKIIIEKDFSFFQPQESEIEKYNRKNLTIKLAEIFNEIIEENRRVM